jgi:hypothetical protein
MRGEGIGFAGVGIKLGLLVSRSHHRNRRGATRCVAVVPGIVIGRLEVDTTARPDDRSWHSRATDSDATSCRRCSTQVI